MLHFISNRLISIDLCSRCETKKCQLINLRFEMATSNRPYLVFVCLLQAVHEFCGAVNLNWLSDINVTISRIFFQKPKWNLFL